MIILRLFTTIYLCTIVPIFAYIVRIQLFGTFFYNPYPSRLHIIIYAISLILGSLIVIYFAHDSLGALIGIVGALFGFILMYFVPIIINIIYYRRKHPPLKLITELNKHLLSSGAKTFKESFDNANDTNESVEEHHEEELSKSADDNLKFNNKLSRKADALKYNNKNNNYSDDDERNNVSDDEELENYEDLRNQEGEKANTIIVKSDSPIEGKLNEINNIKIKNKYRKHSKNSKNKELNEDNLNEHYEEKLIDNANKEEIFRYFQAHYTNNQDLDLKDQFIYTGKIRNNCKDYCFYFTQYLMLTIGLVTLIFQFIDVDIFNVGLD